jgi:hypothetical protein
LNVGPDVLGWNPVGGADGVGDGRPAPLRWNCVGLCGNSDTLGSKNTITRVPNSQTRTLISSLSTLPLSHFYFIFGLLTDPPRPQPSLRFSLVVCHSPFCCVMAVKNLHGQHIRFHGGSHLLDSRDYDRKSSQLVCWLHDLSWPVSNKLFKPTHVSWQ